MYIYAYLYEILLFNKQTIYDVWAHVFIQERTKIKNLVIGVSSNSNSKRNDNDSGGGGVVSAQLNTNKVSNTQKYSEKSENYKQLTMKSFKNTTLRNYYIFVFNILDLFFESCRIIPFHLFYTFIHSSIPNIFIFSCSSSDRWRN